MFLIIHADEIFLKGSNKGYFYNSLSKNLTRLFVGAKVKRIESGLWMEIEKMEQNDIERLACVPGIANFAVAYKCGNKIDKITKLLASEKKLLEVPNSFRVTATRSNKKYPLSSIEIAKEVGAFVCEKYGYKVDLKNFDLNIHIHILDKEAIIYGNTVKGAGGLPSGTSGKMLCLLSGGIDSPVAAYKMMNRGAKVDFIHFQNETSVSSAVGEKIMDLTQLLSNIQGDTKLYMVAFGDIQREIIMKVPADYRMIITRRIFNKIAQKIAYKNKYKALVTGDSLGQVASQTIENMIAIEQSVEILRLKPLIGTNKNEIITIAQKINTLPISNRPYEDCCSMFVAKHPQTKAKLEDVLQIEKNIDLSTIDKTPIKSYNFSMII